jgi:hypothetical protein
MDEKRFDASKAVMAQLMMGGNPNPLVSYFESDRVLLELDIDVEDRVKKARYPPAQLVVLMSIPCFWPHAIVLAAFFCLCGVPCDSHFCLPKRVKKIAKAHSLTLREHSLHYRVKTHTQSAGPLPIVCNLCGTEGPGLTIDEFEEVYPLDMVSYMAVVPAVQQGCFKIPAGSDTLIVKLGGISPVAAIDAPKNHKDFIEQFERQKSSLIESGYALPSDIAGAFMAYNLSSLGAGGPPNFGAALGGMMAMNSMMASASVAPINNVSVNN